MEEQPKQIVNPDHISYREYKKRLSKNPHQSLVLFISAFFILLLAFLGCAKLMSPDVDIAIGEGYGIEKKPDPKGVIKAIKQLDSSCENSVYIGDSEVDIQTAQNAGLPCISVLWGFKDKNFLINNGAKNFAETPNDIIKIIEKNLFLS